VEIGHSRSPHILFSAIIGSRPDLSVTNRIPIMLAASGAATNAMGTQKAARRMEPGCRPSPRPLAFAISPPIAAPNAIPVCYDFVAEISR
jgi:hypothetical protein